MIRKIAARIACFRTSFKVKRNVLVMVHSPQGVERRLVEYNRPFAVFSTAIAALSTTRSRLFVVKPKGEIVEMGRKEQSNGQQG